MCSIRLYIESPNGSTRKEVAWTDLESYRIGRSKDCDLLLNHPSVSRVHCRLVAKEDTLYVQDCESRRGTLLNGERADFEPVEDGARLQLGEVTITVRFTGAAPAVRGRRLQKGGAGEGREPPANNDSERTLVGARSQTSARRCVAIPIEGDVVTVGRDRSACDFKLDDLNISRQHFRAFRDRGRWWIEDLGSTNGTYVNGRVIEGKVALVPGTTVDVGSQHFTYNGEALISSQIGLGITLTAWQLGVALPHPAAKQRPWLLQEITLTIQSGEFVGVLGSSGGGKSTFMRAVSGRSTPGAGQVIYDGQPLSRQFEAFRASIGYAPQKNIFHEDLTLEEALRFASQLRLAHDVLAQEVEENINRVLELVELMDRRTTLIKNLSGGQQRRVSIAIELLGRPRILFLDEVTSGLDTYLEEQMMGLFRRLATQDGITVLIVTHWPNSTEICDKVLYLSAGQLIFFGEPAEMKRFFGVSEMNQIEKRQKPRPAEAWRAEFEGTQEFRHYIADEAYHQPPPVAAHDLQGAAVAGADWASLARQFGILTRRGLQVFKADRLNLLVLALGPVVAWLLCILTRSEAVTDAATYVAKQFRLCVGATLIMYFLGIFGSVREIVKELEVYRHEHFAVVEILPYLLSKIAPSALLGLLQSVVVTLIIVKYGGISLKESQSVLLGALLLTYVAAMLLGLVISAAVSNENIAVMVMLFCVIPQVLFGGGLSGPTGPKGEAALIAKAVITDYWSLEAVKSLIADYPGTPISSLLTSKGLARSLWMLGLHCSVCFFAAVFLMIARDGPNAARTLRRTLRPFGG